MKRSILFVLSLVLLLPLAFTIGEAPATALTCREQCNAELTACLQPCQGVPSCRRTCYDYHSQCVGACP
ncbi:MAG TPA: hypothetical protein VJ885_01290 [Thermoanaerobaculia bacterium]|nr:hypothetical protein [Thermoanaerobaculia bacterium]